MVLDLDFKLKRKRQLRSWGNVVLGENSNISDIKSQLDSLNTTSSIYLKPISSKKNGVLSTLLFELERTAFYHGIIIRHSPVSECSMVLNTHMEKGYDRVVAVSTSLLQDVPTPTDQVPFLVVPHTQCPRPAVAPLFAAPTASAGHDTTDRGTGGFQG